MIMYRTAELRHYQYYVNPSWPGESFPIVPVILHLLTPLNAGGVYASPSMSGSR